MNTMTTAELCSATGGYAPTSWEPLPAGDPDLQLFLDQLVREQEEAYLRSLMQSLSD